MPLVNLIRVIIDPNANLPTKLAELSLAPPSPRPSQRSEVSEATPAQVANLRPRTQAAAGEAAARTPSTEPRTTIRWANEDLTEDPELPEVYFSDSVSSPIKLGSGSTRVTNGAQRGYRTDATTKFARCSLDPIQTFEGGNFNVWYFRLEQGLRTYPREEHIFLLLSKLGEEATELVMRAQFQGIESFEGIVSAIQIHYARSPRKPVVGIEKFARLPLSSLPAFQDGLDFDLWIRNVRTGIMSYPPDERVMILCAKLGGKASAFIMQLFAEENPDLEAAITALRDFFSPPVSEEYARTQFHNRVQLAAETLVEFHASLCQLVRRAYPHSSRLDHDFVLSRILAGMKNRDVAKHFVFDRPTHFDDIRRVSEAFDKFPEPRMNAQNRVQGGAEPSRSPSFSRWQRAEARATDQYRPQTNSQLRRDWAYKPNAHQGSAPQLATGDTQRVLGQGILRNRPAWNAEPLQLEPPTRNRGACYNCGELGHLRNECPHRRPKND